MRNIFSFAVAAALLASPVAVLAAHEKQEAKLTQLMAKADAIQAKQTALEQKAGSTPTAAQQAKLDKLAGRYDKVTAQEQKVRNRIGVSN